MKPLSDDELRMNEQASSIAASVLSEAVVAATRCEQVTMDTAAGAAGVGAISRGMMRGMKAMTSGKKVGGMAKGMETGGLPKSFVLAVTKVRSTRSRTSTTVPTSSRARSSSPGTAAASARASALR